MPPKIVQTLTCLAAALAMTFMLSPSLQAKEKVPSSVTWSNRTINWMAPSGGR